MAGPNVQPYSRFVKPRPVAEATEEDLEAMEEAQDAAKIRERSQRHANKVSEFLGQTHFRVNRTFAFLYWPMVGRQVSVELFFPHLNLAVDRYLQGTSEQRQEAAFKSAKLREHGVRYKALFPENRLADLKEFK